MMVKTLLLSTSILFLGRLAYAGTGFYLGGSISYGDASSTFQSTNESTKGNAAIDFTFGYHLEKVTAFFGPEAGIDLF